MFELAKETASLTKITTMRSYGYISYSRMVETISLGLAKFTPNTLEMVSLYNTHNVNSQIKNAGSK